MNLYEVIFYSSYGKTDGDEDTIYLVSAPDFMSAIEAVWCNASSSNHGGERFPLADVVHEIGMDSSRHAEAAETRIIRGPFIQCAYNYGWKSWRRKMDGSEKTTEWEETFPE
ncbi:MAG: hypothetical protein J0L73_18385 [Verrucomicrobia bacterium]|nr:hypothetical protein [Verrucomicrobiota bacterium]